MKMAVFKSDRFRPFLPDDRQVNPNVLGFELATWLSQSLAKDRVVTSYPSKEDWGWYLIFPDGEAQYQICCSLKRFLRKAPADEMAEELFESVLDCLTESGIEFSVEDA